ncbi:MAG TPA: hypothetical protein ENH29_10305 [Bacteroidetes bacterium]|nr:hypothetical protein [Bacteroidota bacterium]
MNRLVTILFFMTLSVMAETVFSQERTNRKISGCYKEEPLKNILQELESQLQVKFNYLDRSVKDKNVTASFEKKKLPEALKIILEKTDLSFRIFYNSRNIVLFKSKIPPARSIPKYTLCGYVEDVDSGERLMGANVFDERRKIGTTTNMYGFFSLTLPADSVSFTVSYMGYRFFQQQFFLNRDRRMKIKLQPISVMGDTVQIVYSEQPFENQGWMGRSAVPVSQMQYLPELGGEMNILKTFHSFPSSEFMGKGRSGLYIRGGSPD